jgi:hypothetical protein
VALFRHLCEIARPDTQLSRHAMQITMYDTLVPTANRMLGNLSTLLDKAEAFATQKKIEAVVLLNSRLAPDMFALTRQVQIACDMVKGGAARLAGVDIPAFPDTEASVADLKARIAKTLEFVNGIDAAKYAGSEDREIVLSMRTGELRFQGLSYLRDFVLPNLYFHVAATYAILRHNGVEIGKQDFLGKP